MTDAPRTLDGTAVSPSTLLRLVDLGPDVCALVDRHGVITWMSAAAAPVLGLDPAELVGTLAFDLFAKADNRDLHEAYFAGVLDRPGLHGPVEVTVDRPDGELRELELMLVNALGVRDVDAVVVSIRDITRRPGDVEEMRRREAWADALIRRGSELILVTDRTGVVSFANPASTQVLGLSPDEVAGTRWLDLVIEAEGVEPGEFVRGLVDHPSDRPSHVRVRRVDGSIRHLGVYVSNLTDDPDVGAVVVNASDLTDRWNAESFLAEQASLLEAITRGLPLDATLRWLGRITEERIVGAHASLGTLRDDGWVRHTPSITFPREVADALDDMPPEHPLARTLRDSDRRFWCTSVADPGWDEMRGVLDAQGFAVCWVRGIASRRSGKVLGALVVFLDDDRVASREEVALLDRIANLAAIAVERHEMERALEQRALHDPLTGLPNRLAVLEHIQHLLDRPEPDLAGDAPDGDATSVAVMFVDLDRFKVINDSLGHAVGDELLVHVAERFRAAVRPGDVVGRFGGDEFVVVCDGIDDPSALAVADRLRESLVAPIVVDGSEMVVTASVGIARPTDGQVVAADALIRDADVAMYQAKTRGRDTAALYERGSQERVARALDLERALRRALDERELDVHYQPVVDLSDGRLVAFEALVRWTRPDVGPVSPVELIAVAEDSGLILPLGRQVLEVACARAAGWPTVGSAAPGVSVNVSARQLTDPTFPGQVEAALEASGLEPGRLCLEITESALVDDAGGDAVASLRALGVMMAIDDFGTGHASLELLRRLVGVDVVKVDRSFVAGVDEPSSYDRAIVTAVVALAGSLGMDVVAEGVETPGQAEALVALGCRFGQGYWFGRPGPGDEADTRAGII